MTADFGHGAAVLVRQPERWVGTPGTVHEQTDGVGRVELADRELLLQPDSQWCPTRHDHAHVGTGALEERVDPGSGRHQVLEVVEDHQDRSAGKERVEPLDRRGLR